MEATMTKTFFNKLKTGITVLALAMSFSTGTQAASINILDGAALKGVLSFANAGAVLGFTAPATLSATEAQLFAVTPSSEANETNYLNTTLLASPQAVFASKYDLTPNDDDSNFMFQVSSLYFLLKLGNESAYFKNTTGGTLDLRFAKQGQGSGLSHISELNAVPIPAAAWLFGSALAAFGFIGRKKAMNQAV
jgi:hypothetical protein